MRRFFAVLLTLCMVLPLFAALPAFAAGGAPTTGVTFTENDMYYVDGKPASVPYSFSYWVNIPSDITVHSDSRGAGIVASNYTGFDVMPYMHLAVYGSSTNALYPYLEWKDVYDTNNSNAKKHVIKCAFNNVKVETDEWVNISIVLDPLNTSAYCYKNGVLAQTLTGLEFMMGDLENYLRDLPFVIGNDNRNGQPFYFKGQLASVSMFKDMRSAAEVAADHANGTALDALTLADPDTLGHWVLTVADRGKNVQDKSSYGNGLIYNTMWIDADDMALPTDYAYTMIAIGDTQYMIRDDAANGTTYANTVYQWIADRAAALKLQVVMGLGDITDNDKDPQWAVAYNAISKLNGKVAYTLVRGNHDVLQGGAKYDELFGGDATFAGQFSGATGGVMTKGSVTNTYYTFTADGTDWLIVNLDWAPTDEMLAWADGVISDHPTHKVIVNTHCYMHLDATTCDKEDTSSNLTDLQNYGDQIWDKLIYHHENIVMVLSGHQEANLVTMTQGLGKHGNTVSQFLIDPQAVDNYYDTNTNKEPPVGLVTIFYFDKDGKTVDVRHYSPIRNQYYQTVNQIRFQLDAEAEEQNTSWNGYGIAPGGEGTQENPYIINHPGNLVWMGSQVARDPNIKSGQFGVNVPYNEYSAGCFDGCYFKQVCDIDLGGKAISTIGYYSTYEYYESGRNYIRMAAFGGHYDGGGYSIKNGKIISESDLGYTVNFNWCDGLFGCVYGATIENVTLDNMAIHAYGITGGIVGKAIAPADGKAPSDFNVISNCHVKNSCQFYFKFPAGQGIRAKLAYDTIYQSGVIGTVCGVAYATTIRGCTSDAELTVDGYRSLVGGIAGIAGYNTVIDSCAFTGGVTLTDNTARIMQTFGGIVGYAAPNDNSVLHDDKGNLNFDGDLTIRNCYHGGYLTYAGEGVYAQETHWGGILGYAPAIPLGHTILIENCYNLCALARYTDTDWIGGLVGKTLSVGKGGRVVLRSSASVAVAAQGGIGTNEYRAADANTAFADTTVVTATAADMQDGVAGIVMRIARIGNTEPNRWITGNGAPTMAANAGDMYLDAESGDVYQFVNEWVFVMNIKGKDGAPGAAGSVTNKIQIDPVDGTWVIDGVDTNISSKGEQGESGATWTVGEGAPVADAGAGDLYLDTETNDIYRYSDGWQKIGNIEGDKGDKGDTGAKGDKGDKGDTGGTGAPGEDGTDGVDGATWHVGSGTPTNATSTKVGDLYLNQTTNEVYRRTANGWQKIGTVKGDKGDTGATGATGSNGATGTDGVTPQLRIQNGKWQVSYDSGATWSELGDVTVGTEPSGTAQDGLNAAGDGTVTVTDGGNSGGNGLAIAAIVLSVLLLAANVAMVAVWLMRKKKAD